MTGKEIVLEMLALVDAAMEEARGKEREAICTLLETYAVNVGGPGHVKPLIDDHGRGKEDVVRQAYISAIRARGTP